MEDFKYQYEAKRLEFLERKMTLYEQSIRRRSYIRMVLGLFLGVIVAVALWFLFTKEVPSGNRDVVIAIVSGLSGAFFGSVISYYFGDSDKVMEMPPKMDEETFHGDDDYQP